jgi:hypothetical protein
MTDEELEPKPKKKVWPIVLLAVGITFLCGLVCCGGFGFWAFNKFKDLPVALISAQTFLNELSGNRVDEAYQTTSSNYKSTMSLEQFRAFVAKHPVLTATSNTQISGMQLLQEPGVKKAVINALVSSNNNSVACTITLVFEDNVWRVDGFTVPRGE